MSDSTPNFTDEEKKLLGNIRDAFVNRSDVGQDCLDRLWQRFSPDVLHAEDMKTWAECKDAPRRIAWNLATVAPDREQDYSFSNCLSRAFSTLLQEGLDTVDDDLAPYNLEQAKTVLALTWLLTDKDADLHPMGKRFGPWLADHHAYPGVPSDDQFALKVAAKGRALVGAAVLDKTNRQNRARWMGLAKTALEVVGAATGQGKLPDPRNAPPGDASKQSPKDLSGTEGRAKRRKSGRPRLDVEAANQRIGLVDDWTRAKEAGIGQKKFCDDKGISVQHLTRAINWRAKQQ